MFLFYFHEQFLHSKGSVPIENATEETLTRVEKQLQDVAKGLVDNWDKRQNKTKLQEATINAFGEIHELGAENIVSMVSLIKGVLKCLPPRQAELFDPALCYPGFLDWNHFSKAF